MGIIALIVILVVIGIIWGLVSKSNEAKWIIFLGIVAILAWIGSLMVSFLVYFAYGAVLLMLLAIGIVIFKKFFR